MYKVFEKTSERLLWKKFLHSQVVKKSVNVLYHTEGGVYGFIPKIKPTNAVASPEVWKNRYTNCNFYQLVNNYRRHGHKKATINPVNFRNEEIKVPELNPERYDLALLEKYNFKDILYHEHCGNVLDAVSILEQIYCGSISYEYLHLENQEEVEWISQHIECNFNKPLDGDSRIQIAEDLLRSQAWDNFLALKFPTVKRYGGEGAESVITFFRRLISLSAEDDIQHIVLAMPHRGKLNLLTGLLQCPPMKIFNKFKGKAEFPPTAKAMADIASHFNASVDLKVGDKEIHFVMLNNPSHLEAVNPVSMGKARSKQMTLEEGDYSDKKDSFRGDRVLNVQVHGDGAFVGQGINQECLMLSQAPNFNVGGSVHMVVNNQVSFTTPAHRARSCRYTTDLAKTICAPIIHVNADYPELVHKAVELAFAYQREFRKDVFVDLNCYRRWGHNELDDPTFTNPLQYKVIKSRKTVPDLYAEQLKAEGILNDNKIESLLSDYTAWLQTELDKVGTYKPKQEYFRDQWLKMTQAPNAIEIWDTGVDIDTLRVIGQKSVAVPSEFSIHSHLNKTYVTNRLKKVKNGVAIDWATAEALAFGSLLLEGHNVRLSGEDVGRGTFSHRHVMLVDQVTDYIHVPLNYITPHQPGFLEVANSILSEEAVLGYEYGMAIDTPNNLIVWEAQFGDFFNGAQIIIDTFIVSGETKWMTSNGLVMLLPHGYDGAASEHSSCRLERFLQLTDSKESSPDGEDVNLQVVFPTTPAQYFHLLRRQIIRNYRKPLVVVSPKIILRLSDATSALSEMSPGNHFKNVIGDTNADPSKVKRVILVSGKHYYALNEERIRNNVEDVAIIRLECLCPFPVQQLQDEIAKYTRATKFIWSQEEHKNMGAWTFVKTRFENMLAKKLQYSGRVEGATPAVGVGLRHRDEVMHIVHEPIYHLK